MNDLTGKTALVTGSVQGIGLAVAQALAGAGARVAVHGLASADEAQEAVNAVVASGAPEARFFDADMRDLAAIQAMMADVADWGGADIPQASRKPRALRRRMPPRGTQSCL